MLFLKNGSTVAEFKGQHGWLDVFQPGVYRLEATREGKPWIYSNPIYVTPPPDLSAKGGSAQDGPVPPPESGGTKSGGGVVE